MLGRRAAEFVVERCAECPGVAFDGKARTVVVLANMHGDKLLSAISDEFARRVGRLVI